jgi:hypothetical protein
MASNDMASNMELNAGERTGKGPGDGAPELVPVPQPDAFALALPQAEPATGEVAALDGLLSDALFGEVIDVSELIPRVLETPAPVAVPSASEVMVPDIGVPDVGEGVDTAGGTSVALSILYDDDVLASDGGML